jgi:hypothetical protein
MSEGSGAISEVSGANRAVGVDGQPADRRSDGAGRSPAVGINRLTAIRRMAKLMEPTPKGEVP